MYCEDKYPDIQFSVSFKGGISNQCDSIGVMEWIKLERVKC